VSVCTEDVDLLANLITHFEAYRASRRTIRIAAIYALALSGTLVCVAGCTGPVMLRDPQTGKTVQGGADDTEQSVEVAYQPERACIETYQR